MCIHNNIRLQKLQRHSVLFLFVFFYSSCPSRLWRRSRTSPRGGLWSGLRLRKVPAIRVQSVSLRPLETRCPGTCQNTIASSAPSQLLEMCWTPQRGLSSALQVRCSHIQEKVGRSVCDVDPCWVLPAPFLCLVKYNPWWQLWENGYLSYLFD